MSPNSASVSAPVPTPASAGTIEVELVLMEQRSGVRHAQDDWTGVTSSAQRRKLQNRLSQRRYREARANPRRKTRTAAKAPLVNSTCQISADAAQQELGNKFRGLANAVLSCASAYRNADFLQFEPLTGKTRGLAMKPEDVGKLAIKFELLMQQHFLLGSPRVDLLLTLIQFNVFRALINNTQSLGWNFEWLECAEPSSPWHTADQDSADSLKCPLSLRPTSIQRKTDHHPWIDLWPIPKMRDNMLLAAGLYDEDELCNALVEFKDVPNEQTGLVVWGEPWDPASWEVSETFVKNWAWVIQGCTGLLESTNRWRTKRGEKPLDK